MVHKKVSYLMTTICLFSELIELNWMVFCFMERWLGSETSRELLGTVLHVYSPCYNTVSLLVSRETFHMRTR